MKNSFKSNWLVAGSVLVIGLLLVGGLGNARGQAGGEFGREPGADRPILGETDVFSRLEGTWVGRRVVRTGDGPRRRQFVNSEVVRDGDDIRIEVQFRRPGIRSRRGEMVLFADGTYTTSGISQEEEVREIGEGTWSVSRNRIIFEGTATVQDESYVINKQWVVGPFRVRSLAKSTGEDGTVTRSAMRLRRTNLQPES